jgi:tetratricopeptide (TPR) repeat protein
LTSQESGEAGKKAEFERLMTAAAVYRRRGDYGHATMSVKQALALFPDNIDAREFAADMLYAHGDVKRASEHYKAILETEPARASAEAKYARAILELAEADRQRELVKEMVENPAKRPTMPPRNPTVAALLSIAPGFGHIYCGQYLTGAGLFAGWVLAWLLFFATLDSSAGISVVNKLTAPAAVFGCLAAAVHIYSIIGSAREAEKSKRGGGRDLSEPE